MKKQKIVILNLPVRYWIGSPHWIRTVNVSVARSIESVIKEFRAKRHEFEIFAEGVVGLFRRHPRLIQGSMPIVHSIKMRIKDEEHLKEKIERKITKGIQVDEASAFAQITDFAGVRVLHLCQEQFTLIHEVISERIEAGDWVLHEVPKAYTWDPENGEFFKRYKLNVKRKDSFYTSIHYVVKPREDAYVSCELQVRTLFEEIWGELDHTLNYPTLASDEMCREQLKVLAKLVGAGSRLTDSMYRIYVEGRAKKPVL